MNRRLWWAAAAGMAVFSLALPLLAQNRQSGKAQDAALAEHKAQERHEKDQAAERAKRREAARSGQDTRQKGQPQREEEEEEKRDPH